MRGPLVVLLLLLAGCPDDPVPTVEVDASSVDADWPDACPVAAERCNLVDDDCDGQIDEDFPDLGDSCSVGIGACQASGTWICREDGAASVCNAPLGTPGDELCGNRIDDDCDGQTDEDCACPPGDERACGETTGACEAGVQICGADGQWQACEGAIEPGEESCNGLDDDCDGETDELLVVDCTTDQPGRCAAGLSTCLDGQFSACSAILEPVPEECNAVDDDCDGASDEALVQACGTDVGECEAGTQTCSAGSWGECQGDVGPVLDDCDGGDEDCDGVADDGCPVVAVLLHPWNGYTTGSALAAATTSLRKPLRPRFRWRAASGASSYRLQVDDSCDPLDFRTCDFASPERDLAVTTTSHTLAADLTVSQVAPVGRRYFWRVQACKGAQCSAWSEPRYLDVGRVHDDLNGDGYSDLLVGASRADAGALDAGRAYIYLGGPGATWETLPDATLDGEEADDLFASAVAALGDLDGDGFADYAVGAPFHDRPDAMNAGRVYLYRGAAELPARPIAELVLDGVAAGDGFGSALAGPGDVDGDGLADLAVGAPFQDTGGLRDTGRVHVFRGAASGALPHHELSGGARGDSLGWSLASAGDLDGDGLLDVLAGAPQNDAHGTDAGAALIYRGSRTPPASQAADLVLQGLDEDDFFGWAVAGGIDANGDGLGDVAVSSYREDHTQVDAGVVRVYFGGLVPDAQPDGELTGSQLAYDYFGYSLCEAGDVNGDGFDDFVVGEPLNHEGVSARRGKAYAFFGGPGSSFDGQEDWSFLFQWDARFGWAVGQLRDGNGDGFADFVVGDARADQTLLPPGSAYVFFGGSPLAYDHRGWLEGESFHDFFGSALASLVRPVVEVLS